MKTWTTGQMLAAMGAGAVIAGAIGAAVMRPPAGADITLPGSPLYTIAVTESVKGQGEKKEPEPAGTPCPNCGQVHPPAEEVGPAHAHPAAGVSTNYVYCENCKAYHYAAPPVELGSPGASPAAKPE